MSTGDLRKVGMNGRLQGWLTVASAIEADSIENLEWHKRYCILVKEERKLYFFNDTESVLSSPLSPARFKFATDDQDGQCLSTSQRKNALTLLDPNYTPFQRGTRATRSFRDKVKSSLQKSVRKTSKTDNFSGGGSVRVGRSKSFGKADRLDMVHDSRGDGASGGSHLVQLVQRSVSLGISPILQDVKLGSSLDNIHRVSSTGTADSRSIALGEHRTYLDLASRSPLNIKEVHQSISPRHSCFRITTETDIMYASCGSLEDLNEWVTSLRDCQYPNRNHLRRLDIQLSAWILEARNVQSKKSYYCEIYLNEVIYARTCCKLMNGILFWGEPFNFFELPALGSVTIKLFRENYNKKKRERTPATDLGKIEIPALVLEDGQIHEKWYPLTMYPSVKGGSSRDSRGDKERENPSMRVKLQYQVVSILPLKVYDDLLRFLKTDYSVVCDVLEPIISAKAKDEIAQTLVRILQVSGKVKELLCDIIMAEVQHVENENLIFRGNTFATKAVDTYMKMVGVTYLRQTLSGFICVLLEVEDDCEVDPLKLQPGASLRDNQAALTALVERAWLDILSSFNKFPSDLRNTLHAIRQRFSADREDACFKLISGSIFLRFFCPAILSPSLFQLCQEYPDERVARKLTLVAKVIQNLANFARFGVKEEYMCFMNEFVEKEIKNMKQFIDRISTPVSDAEARVEWGPHHIDLGKEASVMHTILTSQLKTAKLDEATIRRIEPLPSILDQISRSSEEEEGDPFSSTYEALRVMQSTISKFNTSGGTERATSESSSEYTTPAQSQPTSPSRELSPPPAHQQAQAVQMINTLLGLSPSPPQPRSERSVSPTISPTHPTTGVSRLATHSHMAAMAKGSCESLPTNSRTSPPSASQYRYSYQDPPSPRRLSDSALHRHGVKPKQQQQQTSGSDSKHSHSRSIDESSFRFDEHIEIAKVRAENAQLLDEIERLKREMERRNEADKRHELIRRDSQRSEEARRKAEQDLRSLRDSRGKMLRGLNTQTEITLVQFKRDFENLKKQLQAKDEIIAVQERRIASLIEANCTLRSGLQELQSLPKPEDSDSDLEDGLQFQSSLNGKPAVANGLSGNLEQGGGLSVDLMHVISELGSGRFDQP